MEVDRSDVGARPRSKPHARRCPRKENGIQTFARGADIAFKDEHAVAMDVLKPEANDGVTQAPALCADLTGSCFAFAP